MRVCMFTDASFLQWKPSCKTGSARWVYDGVCNDAEVFGALLGLGGPPTFKMKKIPKADFEDAIGDLNVSIRCVYERDSAPNAH